MLFFEGKKTLASWGCIVDVNPLAKIFPCGAFAEKEQTNIPEYPEYKPQTIPWARIRKFFSQKHCIFFNFFRKNFCSTLTRNPAVYPQDLNRDDLLRTVPSKTVFGEENRLPNITIPPSVNCFDYYSISLSCASKLHNIQQKFALRGNL